MKALLLIETRDIELAPCFFSVCIRFQRLIVTGLVNLGDGLRVDPALLDLKLWF